MIRVAFDLVLVHLIETSSAFEDGVFIREKFGLAYQRFCATNNSMALDWL